MSKLPTIFLSYNSGSDLEETLAVRLHTIGAVHGFRMLLPDRYDNSELVSAETRNRIVMSDYFILFSTSVLGAQVQEEIAIAFQHLNDKSKIIVIFDRHKGKNIHGADNCTQIYIDSRAESTQQILERILAELKSKEIRKPTKKQTSTEDIVGGILLAGLGLLVLGALLDNGKGK
ncbi:MAG: hypothetical protein IAE95_09910 [Chitinophagaceae bacterium]|nr:hypothetical protein [Chitinophagaceae bacterium]